MFDIDLNIESERFEILAYQCIGTPTTANKCAFNTNKNSNLGWIGVYFNFMVKIINTCKRWFIWKFGKVPIAPLEFDSFKE